MTRQPDPWSPAPGRSGDDRPRRRRAHDAARRPRRQRGSAKPVRAASFASASRRPSTTSTRRSRTPARRGADRHDLRAADDLPGQAAAGGVPARARGRRRPAACRATGRRGRSRSEAGFASATGRRCGRARSRGRSTARWRPVSRRSARATRGRSSVLRTCRPDDGVPPASSLAATGSSSASRGRSPDFAGADDDDVLLRGAADAAGRPGGSQRVPGRRPVLRGRVPRRAAGRDPTEPLLPRHAAAPRGRLRRRPHGGRLASGGNRSGRTRRGRLGLGWADRLPSSMAPGSPPSTASTGRSSSSSRGSSSSASASTRRARCFGNNARLRRAVNFAIDRGALAGVHGGPPFTTPTDQYLPPGIPDSGTRASIRSRPTCAKARALARGHTRGGKVMLYTLDVPSPRARADRRSEPGEDRARRRGQGDRLRRTSPDAGPRRAVRHRALHLGCRLPRPLQLHQRAPGRALHRQHERSRFDSPTYNARMRQRGPAPRGSAYRAYRQLDVQLARDAGAARRRRTSKLVDDRLQAHGVHRAATGPRPDRRLPQGVAGLRCLHRHPDERRHRPRSRRGVADLDRPHDLVGRGVDAGDRSGRRVGDPDRARSHRDRRRAVADGNRRGRGRGRVDPR